VILSLIVAASTDDTIGHEGSLPWYLPEDLRRFRRLTNEHAVIVGRATQISIETRLGGPLPNRRTIAISRKHRSQDEVRWVSTPSLAMQAAEEYGSSRSQAEYFVIGGATIYSKFLPVVSRVYLTRVHRSFDGDTKMPQGWLAGFSLLTRHSYTSKTGIPFTYEDYHRSG
jgi:dihydrofolate reductase